MSLSPSRLPRGSWSIRGFSTHRDVVDPDPDPGAEQTKADSNNQERKRKRKRRLKFRKEPRSAAFPTVCWVMCAVLFVCLPFHFRSRSRSRSVPPLPFLLKVNRICCVQEPPPAVGQAPDVMANPQMAALVAPIDATVLFPFYAEVNINNAKFRWYKTGQLENSKSFYAVLVVSCHPSPLSTPEPEHRLTFFLIGVILVAHFLELPGGQEKRPRESFAGTRSSGSESVAG